MLLILTVISSYAQHNNMKKDEEGGYRSKKFDTKPLEHVEGVITKLDCTFLDADRTEEPTLIRYDIQLNDQKFHGSIAREGKYNAYNFDKPADSIRLQLTKALKDSKLLQYNQWNVYVNGLPPISEFYINAKFSTGEKFFMEFNGGRAPNGFMEAVKIFNDAVYKAAEFSLDKCEKAKPYVNPYIGEHHFHYQKNGKEQFFVFKIEKQSQNDNAEVISYGSYGKFHARCNASNVGGRYFCSILSYYEDSEITTPAKKSLAGILDNNKGTIYLVPLQAAPELPDRSEIKSDTGNAEETEN